MNKPPFFICSPITADINVMAPSSKSRRCNWCDMEIMISPNMQIVEKRETDKYDVIFTCRADVCLDKCKALSTKLGHALKPSLGRDYFRDTYNEYPPV